MEGVITIVVALGVLLFLIFWFVKGVTPTSKVSALHDTHADSFRPPARRASSRLSAAEMLSRVQALRGANAQWNEIWSQLNPSGDSEVQHLLAEVRGPHMFAPHLGLGVIEEGCKRILASSPAADSLAALHEAIRGADPFVR